MLPLPATFLTLPASGDPTFRSLRRKLRLIALRRLLTHPLGGLSPALAGGLLQLRRVVTDAARRDRARLLDAVGSPDVLTPLLCLEAGLRDAEPCLADAGLSLLAGLVAARLLPEGFIWQVPARRLISTGRLWTADLRAVAALPTGLELELGDGQRIELATLSPDAGSHPLGHGVHLALFDTNPLAMDEAHPDKQGNQLDLGDRPVTDWTAALREALGLVEAGLPEWIAELPQSLQRLVPVGFQPELHLSASYREAPGLAYLTLHPSPLTLAEAIVHETQHGRLNVLTWLDPVLDNGWTEWTDSPVRPDLRPLMGVLLAVHAFVPVAALHARLAAAGHPLAQGPDFERRRLQVLSGNQRGLDVLEEKARPTPPGRRLLADLRRLHDALRDHQPQQRLDPGALPPG